MVTADHGKSQQILDLIKQTAQESSALPPEAKEFGIIALARMLILTEGLAQPKSSSADIVVEEISSNSEIRAMLVQFLINSGLSAEKIIELNLFSERERAELVVERLFEGLNGMDIDKVLALHAADATIDDPFYRPRIMQGLEQIRESLIMQGFNRMKAMHFDVKRMSFEGGIIDVTVEANHALQGNEEMGIREGAMVHYHEKFEIAINEQGKITSSKAYTDAIPDFAQLVQAPS